MPAGWVFDKRPLNDVCKLNMPKNWHLEVYKVTSGDSGEKYWVQILCEVERKGVGLKFWSQGHVISLCDCPPGKFAAPLIVLGLEDFICKHGQELLAYLRSRK